MRDLCRLIGWMVVDLIRSRAALEIWTLRQQINVLRRTAPKKLSFCAVEQRKKNVQMGRGKRHQGCESAAGHRVGIQGIGCGRVERLDRTSRESSCSRPVAGSG